MKAVVMAGGEGSRLRPLTSNEPKPMLPLLGRPLMEHVLRLARRHGVEEAVATVHFLAGVVRNAFGDGSELGMDLSYVVEEEPLGTAGSVKNAERLLGDRFLVLSGDALTDVDLTELVRFHREHDAAVTVTLKRADDPLEFGIVITDAEGRVERFLEKPGWGDVFSDTVNTGIYVIDREVLDLVPAGEEFDFAKDLFPLLLAKGYPIYGYVTDRFWTDVGTIESYLSAHRAALDGEVELELEGFQLQSGIWLGEGAELHPDAEVRGPLYIGPGSKVEGGATLREYTVLGRGVTVKHGAFLHRAIVHDYVYVGATSSLRGCVVGRNSDVRFGARLEEGVVVANDCHVGEAAVLNPEVKVYPFKSIDPGAVVAESIVWQSAGRRSLFGDRGVSGLFNIDVTPEMTVRLALAYASLLPPRSSIVTCRDVSRSARIVKRAMIAGINSAGLDCHDLELIAEPVARFYARSARSAGGFAVRSAPADPDSVEIQFFDERGIDIPPAMQRLLERSFYRDDLRRAFHHEIGELNFPARAREYYLRGVLDSLDVGALRRRRPKLVIDYGCGGTALTGPRILGPLGGQVLAVNAVLDEERAAATSRDLRAELSELSRLTRSSGAELGVRFDSSGDRLQLIDGAGRILRGRTSLLAYAWLVAATAPSPWVALPVSTSREAQRILERAGGGVVWTATSPATLMEAAASGEVIFAGDENGGFIFPEFLTAYDSVLAMAKLLEFLERTGLTLKEVVDRLPPVHIVRRDVPTPWEAKGTVMRRLLEDVDQEGAVTIDGVKAYRGRDWALVVPHPQEPVVRVWAEADTPEAAAALAAEFVSKVEAMRA